MTSPIPTIGKSIKRAFDFFANANKSMNSIITELFSSNTAPMITEERILTITPAWRAIAILSDTIANTPFNLYEIDAANDGVNVLTDDPLHKLVNQKPHPLHTPYTFRKALMINTLISGNGLAIIRRNNLGIPTSLEVVKYDRLHDVQVSYGDMPTLTYFIMHPVTKMVIPYDSQDVIHIPFMTMDGLIGLNTASFHKTTFSTEASMVDFVNNFLQNGAFPSGIISVDGVLSDKTYQRFKDTWHEKDAGAKKAGKVGIIDGGAKFSQVQQSIPGSGYDTVRSNSISDIARIFGLPEYMLDPKNKPTYSSIEQLSTDLKEYTLKGWFTTFSQEFTRKLVSKNRIGKVYYDFDQTGLINADLKTTGEYFTRLFNMSALNADEIRKFLKLNPIPDGHGKRRYVQGNNMVPVEAVDQLLQSKMNKSKNPKKDSDPSEEKDPVETDLPTLKEQ